VVWVLVAVGFGCVCGCGCLDVNLLLCLLVCTVYVDVGVCCCKPRGVLLCRVWLHYTLFEVWVVVLVCCCVVSWGGFVWLVALAFYDSCVCVGIPFTGILWSFRCLCILLFIVV